MLKNAAVNGLLLNAPNTNSFTYKKGMIKMYELCEGVYYVGVKDPDLKIFDIIMETEFGTTYNSYIVKGEKTALIEASHDKLSDEFINNIEEIVPISELDYIICNHTEPDHSGALAKILAVNPNITVIGTIAALKNLKEITNMTFKEQLAKDGAELDLGAGVVLKFIVAPNLHWPDTMMTYYSGKKILFSCDVLGAHYCTDGVTDRDIANKADYDKAMKLYYDCIVSPFNPFVVKGLEKLAGLEIDMVCNSHGPVLIDTISEAIDKYVKWSAPVVNSPKKIAVLYVSAYGYTEMLANEAAEALSGEGYDVSIYNVIDTDSDKIYDALHSADAVMLGTPTINRNALKPIWDIVGSIDVVASQNKKFAVFGSYGWSGEGCGLIHGTLKSMRLKVYSEPLKVIFKPTQDNLEQMRKYALDFAADI